MTNRNPETKFFRDVNSLSPGDVIITNCLAHGRSAILVLARRGDWFDLSTDAPVGRISISIDPKGPWRWNRHQARFTNEQGDVRSNLEPGRVEDVQRRAGIEELGWYEGLPRPDQVRFHVSPDHMIGNADDSATMAKLRAFLDRLRSASDPQQSVNAMVQLIEFAFTGAEHLLDKRRVNLLAAATNAAAGIIAENAVQRSQRNPLEGLIDALMGGEGRSGQGHPLSDLFAEMELGRGRRECRDPHDQGDRSHEHAPHHGGNGDARRHEHDHHGGY